MGSEESRSESSGGKITWLKMLFDFLKDAKWAISFTIGGFLLLLIIHPQLSNLMEELIGIFDRLFFH